MFSGEDEKCLDSKLCLFSTHFGEKSAKSLMKFLVFVQGNRFVLFKNVSAFSDVNEIFLAMIKIIDLEAFNV